MERLSCQVCYGIINVIHGKFEEKLEGSVPSFFAIRVIGEEK